MEEVGLKAKRAEGRKPKMCGWEYSDQSTLIILKKTIWAFFIKKLNDMKRLILLLLFGSCMSCQHGTMIDDTAARLSGQYVVESYVVNGDTLYASAKINKINAREFYIYISRKTSDSLYITTTFKEIGAESNGSFLKDVGMREVNGSFELSSAYPDYEGSITGHSFRERAQLGKGAGFLVKPSSLPFPTTNDPALEGVFITATKVLRE